MGFFRNYSAKPSDPYARAYVACYDQQQLPKILHQIGAAPDHPNWNRPSWGPSAVSLTIPDQSSQVFYCSHVLEQLTDSQSRTLLREVHRVLKPGAIFRAATLNAVSFYEAYRRRDVFVNLHYGLDYPFGEPGKNTFSQETMSIWLVNQIASQLIQSYGDGHVPIFAGKASELDALFDRMPMAAAFDYLCGMVDTRLQAAVPTQIVNWWSPEKLARELINAGFSKALVSVPGGSIVPVLRDPQYFDRNIPTLSFYIDAVA